MSPEEHYEEAERLLRVALGDFPVKPISSEIVAAAQVHATLATFKPEKQFVMNYAMTGGSGFVIGSSATEVDG